MRRRLRKSFTSQTVHLLGQINITFGCITAPVSLSFCQLGTCSLPSSCRHPTLVSSTQLPSMPYREVAGTYCMQAKCCRTHARAGFGVACHALKQMLSTFFIVIWKDPDRWWISGINQEELKVPQPCSRCFTFPLKRKKSTVAPCHASK